MTRTPRQTRSDDSTSGESDSSLRRTNCVGLITRYEHLYAEFLTAACGEEFDKHSRGNEENMGDGICQ